MKNKHIFSALGLLFSVVLLISCSEEKSRDNTEEVITDKKSNKVLSAIMWGEAKNGLVLGIQTTKGEFNQNETSEFIVFLKNEGKKAVDIPFFFFGLSALEIKIINDNGEEISFMKECLETELGDPITLSPNQIISATQQVILTKNGWEGSKGKYKVTAIYDTTDYKKEKLWSDKCFAGPLEFTVK